MHQGQTGICSNPTDTLGGRSECDEDYRDWCRDSINLELDDFDDDYIEEASTATCPSCGRKVEISKLIVEGMVAGFWVRMNRLGERARISD